MATLTLEVAEWLCSPAGLAALDESTARLDAGADELQVGTWLRGEVALTPERATAVVGAARARRRARQRWPDADRLVLEPTALEQASDPAVAAWRAQRMAGHRVWDLCAGIGGDTLAIAATAAEVTAVDLDPARLRLLAHNAEVLGRAVTTRCADALEVHPPADAWVHADPSRRRDGRRVRRLADHLPPVDALLAAHRDAVATGVVLSPAVDLDDPALPGEAELEFVADEHGLKESIVWLGAARSPGVLASATLLPDLHRVRRAAPPTLPVGRVGTYVVEVAPAAVRARLHPEIGLEIGARRLARRRALLTTDGAPPPSPWYRARPVLAVLPARDKAVRRWLRDHVREAGEVPFEIVTHGLPADPDLWWRALGRPARGPQGYRIELVRTDDGAQAIVTDARQHP
jgi:SAM-dependent methyltransferase